MSALRSWLASRTPRERRLLGLLLSFAIAIGATATTLAVRDHCAALAERVAARERELAAVRQLAARLRAAGGVAPDATPLVSRIEGLATSIVGRDRLAAMTPGTADDGRSHVSLRVSDAALPEVVALLHAVESARPTVVVTRLDVRPHSDDATRFDLTAEVASSETPAS